MTVGPKEWDSWIDPLGQTFKVGDYIAYPVGGGRSAAILAYGKVKRINRINSYKKEIMVRTYDRQTGSYSERPSCTVTVLPLNHKWQLDPHLKTLQKVESIIKIPSRLFTKQKNAASASSVANLRAIAEELS